MLHFTLCWLLVWSLEQEPLQRCFVQRCVAVLQSKGTVEAKGAALHFLEKLKTREVHAAIPAMEALLDAKESPSLRCSTAYALGGLAYHHKLPCPRSLVKALLDQDEEVAESASTMVGISSRFHQDSLDLLLQACRSPSSQVRSSIIFVLPIAERNDPRVKAMLLNAQTDINPNVRGNAHVALFKLTDQLEPYLTHLIKAQEVPDEVFGKVDNTTDAGKRDETVIRLYQLSAAMRFVEFSEHRAQEYSLLLCKFLDSREVPLRWGAIRLAKASFRKIDVESALNANKTPNPVRERFTKSAAILLQLDILGRLTQLEKHDPERHVRTYAGEAISEIRLVRDQLTLPK